MRKAAVIVLTIVFFTASTIAQAGFLSRLRNRDGADADMFPGTGTVEGLERTSKIVTYRGNRFDKEFGEGGYRYRQFGLSNLKVADYNYGGSDKRVVIELATMDNMDGAAGLFHFYRGIVLKNSGAPVDVGAEGVIDQARGGSTIYFYKSNIFGKIIYSGKAPVPDLLPIAKAVDNLIKTPRTGNKPEGFNYIDIPGVVMDTVAVTPGATFSTDFLPPSVWASAPGGGSAASDLFIITRRTSKEASALAKDYAAYMRMMGDNFEEVRRGKQRFYQGVDPTQGRVIFTAYKTLLIIAARPDGYEKGEQLIEKVMQKYDSINQR